MGEAGTLAEAKDRDCAGKERRWNAGGSRELVERGRYDAMRCDAMRCGAAVQVKLQGPWHRQAKSCPTGEFPGDAAGARVAPASGVAAMLCYAMRSARRGDAGLEYCMYAGAGAGAGRWIADARARSGSRVE